MRLIGYVLAGCIALAILQAALKLLVAVLLFGLAISLFYRTKETIGVVLLFAAASQPKLLLAFAATGIAAALIEWLRR